MRSRPSRRLAAATTVAALVAPIAVLAVAGPATAAVDPSPLVVEAAVASGAAGSAGALDLSQVGAVDWIHPTGETVDRKAGADQLVLENLNPARPMASFGDSPYSYRWSDGAPTPASAGTTSGAVFRADGTTVGEITSGAGYVVTIPAADTVRRAVLVGGVWQAEAEVTVTATSGTAPVFETTTAAAGSARVHLYTITLRPGQGASFTSRITETRIADGNVSLGAVAVSDVGLGADAVTLTSQSAPADLDLTRAGGLDWVHLDGPDVNQAVDGDALQVTSRAPQVPIATQSDNPVRYSWTDGTPVLEQSGTHRGGVFLADSDDFTRPYGFDLTVAAGDRARTLQLVSGAWQASATITVTVNGEAAPAQTSTELSAGGAAVNRLFVVTLRPGDSAVVSAQLTGRADQNGNVTLGAAALAETPSAEDAIRALLGEIADADVSAAEEAVLDQLDREVASAEALLDDPAATDEAARVQLLLLDAAFRAARDSVAGVQYAFDSSPGLVSSFGWEGDRHAPIAYVDGSYLLRDRGDLMITFGVPEIPGKIEWRNAEGYLPAFISEYSKRGLDVSVQSFADEATVGGNRYEIAYSRMTVHNTTDEAQALPRVSPELVPLVDVTATQVAPGATVVRDYAVAADRFTGTYAWPSAEQVRDLGGYDDHYTHMRDYWNDRLADIAEITALPNGELVDAYKAGYIYTLIIRDDIDGEKKLHVGENGYDVVFDHDTIGIVATLLTIGDFTYAQDYLRTLPAQLQYDDAKWKYSWPFALYLQRTGDLDFIRQEFENIKTQTHKIETDRVDGGAGIMKQTFAIDSLGYWTIDNWSALAGLTTYRYLAEQLGEDAEAAWAEAEYADLEAVATARLQQTIDENGLDYLPISMVEANEDGPRGDPRDANWASMFLFGRWAWDGYLFGADQSGIMLDWIDQTYTAGFERRAGISESIYNFGGYPHGYYSSAYNAGYGSSALRGEAYRDSGIRAYEFMIDHAQSGPFGWWEGVDHPDDASPWARDHATGGGGSNQHMWGQSTATKVLFDSLIAQRSDGTVIVGRGVPDAWLASGEEIALDRYPVDDGGRVGYSLTSTGTELSLTLTGDLGNVDAFSIELPGLRDNIADVSDGSAEIDQAAGTVVIPGATGGARTVSSRAAAASRTVTITLRHETGAAGQALTAQVDGRAQVGSTLAASVADGWTATDHQWLRDGEPVDGATGTTYALTRADLGSQIRVRVSGTQPGWTPASVESAAVGPVVRAGDPAPGAGGGGTSADAGAGSGVLAAGDGWLATTGARVGVVLAVALALLAAGGAVLVSRRRWAATR